MSAHRQGILEAASEGVNGLEELVQVLDAAVHAHDLEQALRARRRRPWCG